MFRMNLQPSFKIATIVMKRLTHQQHKEVVMLCEKRMAIIEARNALLIPQTTK
jgi:hypothetical protein